MTVLLKYTNPTPHSVTYSVGSLYQQESGDCSRKCEPWSYQRPWKQRQRRKPVMVTGSYLCSCIFPCGPQKRQHYDPSFTGGNSRTPRPGNRTARTEGGGSQRWQWRGQTSRPRDVQTLGVSLQHAAFPTARPHVQNQPEQSCPGSEIILSCFAETKDQHHAPCSGRMRRRENFDL